MSKDIVDTDDPTVEETFFPGIGSVAVSDPPMDGPPPIDDDEDFAPRPRFRLSALSILLIVILIAGIGFLGGVSVGKNHASTSSGTGAARTGGTARGAFGGEGFAGFGGGAAGAGGAGTAGTGTAGTGTAGTGTAGTGTGGTGTATAAATPVVIGTISSVSGKTVVVKNLGGTSITVHLSATTTVTKLASTTASALAAGQAVSVYGTTAADKSVTATNLTIR
jgi:hypothetical protein